MKKFKIYLLAIIMIGANACSDDFLNIVPETSESAGSFYKTEQQINQSVNATYRYLQDYIKSAYILEELQSDNTIMDNFGDAGVLNRYSDQESFFMTADYNVIENAWTLIYRAIGDINQTLSKLPDADISAEVSVQAEGELKFLRAWFYFVAVRYWGEIPLVTKPITIPESFATGKASVDEVYAQIIADLRTAESNLPVSYDVENTGRVTKGAALTMLGAVYLTTHQYANAETELRKVIDLGVYQLMPEYKDLWGVDNENGPESIFEIQFIEGDEYGLYNTFQQTFACRRSVKLIPTGLGAGVNIPTKDMINAYEPGDLRFDASLVFDTVTVNYQGVDTTVWIGSCNKYTSPSTMVDNHNGNNWMVYRYADVLLMLSEALNEQGYNNESFTLINQIRDRADLPDLSQTGVPDQAAFRLAMEHERKIEFVYENKRWFDLARTGRTVEVMTTYGQIELADLTTPVSPTWPISPDSYNVEEYETLFPIPNSQIMIYDIGQNQGY